MVTSQFCERRSVVMVVQLNEDTLHDVCKWVGNPPVFGTGKPAVQVGNQTARYGDYVVRYSLPSGSHHFMAFPPELFRQMFVATGVQM